MFDVITYDKGGVGPAHDRAPPGRRHVPPGPQLLPGQAPLLRTPITTDLWDALEVASGQPVRATMGTWVNQAGHPVVSVELADGGTDLQLSQRRFLLDGGIGQRPASWVVPVSLRYATTDGSVSPPNSYCSRALPPRSTSRKSRPGCW